MPNQNPRNPFPAWRLPKGMINASDDELEKSIGSCERWEWFGGGLVFAGVAATVAIAIVHPEYDSFLEQWGSAIADSLVAAGVAIEIKFGQMAGLRQNELKRRSDEKVAEANNIAAQATKDAADARERTALLEKLTAWRRLDQDFCHILSDAFLDTTSILQLRIEYQQGDPEAFTYASDFAQAFTDLGVQRIVFLSNAHFGTTAFGVHIEIGECEQSDDWRLACLAAFGVDIKPKNFGLRHSDPGLPKPNLYMFVGPKSLTQKPRRSKRLMANWIAARVTKAARVSARFS
jgi:hypothetical protein